MQHIPHKMLNAAARDLNAKWPPRRAEPEAAHAATDVDERTAPRIPRWNEGPNYPHGTSPGLGLAVLIVSGCISVAAFLHLAGWLGWL